MPARRIAEKRIWPAIDVFKSGTRKEERLLSLLEQNAAWNFRRGSQNETETGIMENLLKLMSKLKTNAELLAVLSKPKVYEGLTKNLAERSQGAPFF